MKAVGLAVTLAAALFVPVVIAYAVGRCQARRVRREAQNGGEL